MGPHHKLRVACVAGRRRIRQAEYCAANAGTVGLTWALAEELAEFGITATFSALLPRPGHPSIWNCLTRLWRGRAGNKTGEPFIPYDETPPPELFSAFIAYLASDEAAHITGSVFMTMGNFIGLYSYPAITTSMVSMDGPWTMEKIIAEAPKTLLKGYKNINQKE